LRRRDFIYLTGMGAGAMMLPGMPGFGKTIDPQEALNAVDVRIKKELADAGLTAAKAAGASYADVRIGRYLNQFVITRENKRAKRCQYRIIRCRRACNCQRVLGLCCY
jgi:TldD protein